MDYSTQITEKLVPRFLDDLCKLIIDKDECKVGDFELLFKAPKLRELTEHQEEALFKELVIEGKNIPNPKNPKPGYSNGHGSKSKKHS